MNLEEELKLEHKANQTYSELLIEQNHKLERIEELARNLNYFEILEVLNEN